MLNVPVYSRKRNHVEEIKLADDEVQDKPWVNLHRRLSGKSKTACWPVEGSLRWLRQAPVQPIPNVADYAGTVPFIDVRAVAGTWIFAVLARRKNP